MTEFPSWRSYENFANSVTKEWRFTRSPDQVAFLDAVLANADTRQEMIPVGAVLWRAQEGHDWREETYEGEPTADVPVPFGAERMKPLRHQAKEGRANPKGISYLYAASHERTAIAEVRPWVGAYVSLASLTVLRPLRIVNCTSKAADRLLFYFNEPASDVKVEANWALIDRAFSRPVTPNDRLADYVPTQVIAEMFRQNRFDGIAYRSSLEEGHNFAIFDLDAVKVSDRKLCRVRKLKFEIENE